MRIGSTLAFLLLLASSLAGCAGGSGSGLASPDPDSQAYGDAEEGATLFGTVLTTELSPIVGALVSLDGTLTATTDEAGAFEFRNVPPGDHKVFVHALGFTSVARSVILVIGEPAQIQFALEPLPVQEAYTELVILRGFSVCDISLVVWITFFEPCALGTPKRNVQVMFAESWRYGVIELEWNALESFVLYTSADGNCNPSNQCWGAAGGRSPLRVEAAPADEDIAKKYAPFTSTYKPYPEGKFRLQSNILYLGALQKELDGAAHDPCVTAIGFRFGCPGVGVSAAGIPFNNYVSVFHWERPSDPSRYSGMPDK
ncbi:MAG TPA: carboxypeptidase-like regulatory domain-containing protein [Candidatus Thermoplasmatota archaeon]|nr:carboxypeptidase-like regulatory domain-containing protein [Candidatus Thermoplasmatota archaeon]